jgi:pimeloyl-ACP methyl ester carboxylesterase
MNFRFITLAFALAFALSACGPSRSPAAAPPKAEAPRLTPLPTSDGKPKLIAGHCLHGVPYGLAATDLLCGRLRLPQNPLKPDDLWVELPYTLVKRSNPNSPAAPILYLVGGDGGSALSDFDATFEALQTLHLDHDLIFYAMRGMPLAQPKLDCAPFASAINLAQDKPTAELRLPEAFRPIHEQSVGLPACAVALYKLGIDLAFYDTEAHASDAVALVRAFGYEQVNIYAASYGTRVALELMRQKTPELRAVVLDSPLSPSVRAFETTRTSARYEVALKLLSQCANDIVCETAFPRLSERYPRLLQRLNENPLALELSDQPTFGGTDLMALMLTHAQSRQGPYLPLILHELDRREPLTRTLVALLQGTLPPAPESEPDPTPLADVRTRAAKLATDCRDEKPFNDFQMAQSVNKTLGVPENSGQDEALQTKLLWADCTLFPTGNALPRQSDPVKSDLPTLVFQGLLDVNTPPSWAVHTTRTLSNHFYFEFPAQQHVVIRQPTSLRTGCAAQMAASFFEAPDRKPSAGCILPSYRMAFVIEGNDPAIVARQSRLPRLF